MPNDPYNQGPGEEPDIEELYFEEAGLPEEELELPEDEGSEPDDDSDEEILVLVPDEQE